MLLFQVTPHSDSEEGVTISASVPFVCTSINLSYLSSQMLLRFSRDLKKFCTILAFLKLDQFAQGLLQLRVKLYFIIICHCDRWVCRNQVYF